MPRNERFCGEAAAFIDELLVRGRVRDHLKYEKQRIVSPHRAIHTQLRKYEKVVRHLSLSTDVDRSTLCYRLAMSKLHAAEFAAYFAWLRKAVHSDQAKQRMACLPNLPSIKDRARSGCARDRAPTRSRWPSSWWSAEFAAA